jgi:hypothetical protein
VKRLIVFLLLALLTGCGTGVPDVDGTDWCFKYDFTLSDNGFNIVEGSWVDGSGLLTDAEGDLIFSYEHDRFVAVSFVIVTVKRAAPGVDNIAIVAAGDVFGVSAGFSTTMPAGITTYPAVFQSQELGVEGKFINVTAQSSHPLYLQSIEMRGMGGSPFGVNICDDSQPLTPSTDTPTPVESDTPTMTASVTLTRTQTHTPTPTATETPPWLCVYDFTIDDGGFASTGTFDTGSGGIYNSGVGWEDDFGTSSGNAYRMVQIAKTISSALITSIAADFDVTNGTQGGEPGVIASHDTVLQITTTPFPDGPGTFSWSGSATATAIGIRIQSGFIPGSSSDPGGSVIVSEIRVRGTGPKPEVTCTDETEPTPTPSITPTPGTLTPTQTATAPAGWTCTHDFDSGGYGWVSAFNATYADVAGLQAWRATTTDPNSLGIRYVSGGVMPLTSIRIKGRTFGTRMDDEHELNFRTYFSSWSSYTQDSHDATLFDETYSYTGIRQARRIEVYLSVTQTNVTASRIDLIELRGVGGTNPCADSGTPTVTAAASLTPTGTGTGTLTPRPLVTGTAGIATRTPIVFPTINIDATLVPGTPGTGTPPTAETGTPSTAIPAEQIGDESGEIIGFGWQIGWGLFRTLFAWVGQITNDIGALMDAFINTPPEAIPGLPLCMTAPMEHDICAIYYIMDWTLFAPNTPGQFIIPVVLLIMNLFIFMKFVSWVLRLIRRGESATHVQ